MIIDISSLSIKNQMRALRDTISNATIKEKYYTTLDIHQIKLAAFGSDYELVTVDVH